MQTRENLLVIKGNVRSIFHHLSIVTKITDSTFIHGASLKDVVELLCSKCELIKINLKIKEEQNILSDDDRYKT